MVTAKTPTVEYGLVPRCWPGETVVCLASGASLTPEDVASCRGRARVIAIKDTVEWAPWADVLYACGADRTRWWHAHGDAMVSFPGLRYTLDLNADKWAAVLRNTGVEGLETDPSGLRTGRNSGYQAINVAAHLGAARIVLLGYDMQAGTNGRHHFFKKPQCDPSVFVAMRPLFETLVAPLAALGISVVNATRRTALTCFPQATLSEALS